MLRNLTPEGLDQYFEAYQSGRYQKYFRHFEDFLNKEQIKAIASAVAMEIVVSNRIVGFLNVQYSNKSRVANVGVMIKEEFQKQSHALLSMLETADYLFKKGCLRIICVCCRDDTRAMELLEKAGFLPEARMRGNCFCDGRIRDELRWAMPRETYKKTYKGR